jgi:Ca2+-binding RTX toxin-like protein
MRHGIRIGVASVLATVAVSGFGAAGASAHEVSDCTIVGTPGDDTIDGTEHADVICGLGGDDEINGLGGADRVFGGHGKDVLNGGDDADLLDGGGGDDKLYGFAGQDHLEGEDGDDVLHGGNENDKLSPGIGENKIEGGAGEADKLDYHTEVTTAIIATLAQNEVQSIDESGSPIGDIIDRFKGVENISATKLIDHLFWNNAKIASTVNSHAGDDFIATSDGDGRDSIDCGEGDDVLTSDTGDTASSTCEDVSN